MTSKSGVELRRLAAEGLGTFFLLATVVGSGIMGETLSGGNDALALLGNTIATGAILVVLILVFGPISGAHFNPAVTLAFLIRREIAPGEAARYLLVQVIGGLLGVLAAHLMFELEPIQTSEKLRSGGAQWFAEFIATFGLVATILGCLRFRAEAIPYAVGLYITAGYWFTASTSFANPAVTIARSFTDTFSGIYPPHAPAFILAQLVGAVAATYLFAWFAKAPLDEEATLTPNGHREEAAEETQRKT
ncbi:MAG: aquaporin family protein [Limibacillus sp.]